MSVLRSTTLNGEIFAFFILAILFGSSASLSYSLMEEYAGRLSSFAGKEETSYSFFLLVYLLIDLSLRLILRRPLPKLKYYVLLNVRTSQIAAQYLFTSLFGIIPFLLLLSGLVMASKAFDWYGALGMLSILFWWLTNHYLGLIAQYSKWARTIIGLSAFSVLALQFLLPQWSLSEVAINPILGLVMLLIAAALAFRLVHQSIKKREFHQTTGKSFLDRLPVFSFKNPVFQLEWALIARNKRTRSNLIMGVLSVILLPFLLEENTSNISLFIFFLTTGFFVVQHGVYSLGWEGSYFDFLITNISPKTFIRTRYVFYLGTCLIGLLLGSIPVLIKGLSWSNLLVVFLYNAGVNIPLVLFRSTFNDSKIVLSENSFMNYSGMMTAPIFVSSFLVVLTPLFIYGIGSLFLGDYAHFLLGCIGIIGLLLFDPLTTLITKKYYRRKYHLSQSFKA